MNGSPPFHPGICWSWMFRRRAFSTNTASGASLTESMMNTDVRFRELGMTDRDAYYALRLLGLETRPQAFATSAEEWRAASADKIDALLRLSEKNTEPILGAFTSGGELVGSVCLIPETRQSVRHKASLAALFVHPSWQHQGIGTRLVNETLQRARQMPELMLVRLVVDSENTDAI